MCLRVDLRIECPECDYPISEAMCALKDNSWVKHTPDYPTDSAGARLSVGDNVAYNASGAIARGTIALINRARNLDEYNENRNWIITMKNGAKVRNTDGILSLVVHV